MYDSFAVDDESANLVEDQDDNCLTFRGFQQLPKFADVTCIKVVTVFAKLIHQHTTT